MEGMLPELQALVDKGILDADELRAIIKRREGFEYRLAKRSTELADYIAAIKYEMLLQQLVKDRKARLGIKKQHRLIDFGRQVARSKSQDVHLVHKHMNTNASLFRVLQSAYHPLFSAVQSGFILRLTEPASASKGMLRFGVNGSRTAGLGRLPSPLLSLFLSILTTLRHSSSVFVSYYVSGGQKQMCKFHTFWGAHCSCIRAMCNSG
jgi:hypothetical protein